MNVFQQKLAIVKSFRMGGHVYARIVKILANNKGLKLVKTDHLMHTKVSWDNERAIQTYDDCVELVIEHSDAGGRVKLYIYNGENLHGQPTDLRTVYYFEGDWWVSNAIQEQLERQFKHHCEVELEREAKKEHDLRITLMGQKLLDRLNGSPVIKMLTSDIKPEPVTEQEKRDFPNGLKVSG